MLKDRLAGSLVHLGIDPADCSVLKLLPIVYTAWANGVIEEAARERIYAMAEREFGLSQEGMRVLDGWLRQPLSRAYVLEGMRDLFSATRAVDDNEFDASELPMLLSHAEAIARTTARGMDQPEAVNRSEVQALHDLAALLQVDNGRTWTELVRELDSTAAP
jgi:hypothetical protein